MTATAATNPGASDRHRLDRMVRPPARAGAIVPTAPAIAATSPALTVVPPRPVITAVPRAAMTADPAARPAAPGCSRPRATTRTIVSTTTAPPVRMLGRAIGAPMAPAPSSVRTVPEEGRATDVRMVRAPTNARMDREVGRAIDDLTVLAPPGDQTADRVAMTDPVVVLVRTNGKTARKATVHARTNGMTARKEDREGEVKVVPTVGRHQGVPRTPAMATRGHLDPANDRAVIDRRKGARVRALPRALQGGSMGGTDGTTSGATDRVPAQAIVAPSRTTVRQLPTRSSRGGK